MPVKIDEEFGRKVSEALDSRQLSTRGAMIRTKIDNTTVLRMRHGFVPALKSTKTGKVRTLLIPDSIRGELVDHLAHQEAIKRANAARYTDQGFVNADQNGEPYGTSALTNAFARIADTAQVDVTLHGLRHTWVSLQLAAGTPLKIVSEMAGHSTASFTADRYGHVLTTMQQGATDVTEALLQRTRNTAQNGSGEGK